MSRTTTHVAYKTYAQNGKQPPSVNGVTLSSEYPHGHSKNIDRSEMNEEEFQAWKSQCETEGFNVLSWSEFQKRLADLKKGPFFKS